MSATTRSFVLGVAVGVVVAHFYMQQQGTK